MMITRISMSSSLLACFAALFLGSTTARGQVDKAEWTEEVLLATGQKVIVERVAVRSKAGAPASRRGPIRTLEITFPDKTVWQGNSAIRPLGLEIVDGTPFLAADLHSREMCAKYGNPPGSVVFFRWARSQWTTISRVEYPKGGRINLLREPWGRTSAEDVTGFVKHEDKHTRPGNFRVNEPIDQRISNRSLDACELYKKL